MVKKIFLIGLIFFLRFYRIGQVPPSLSWDEAAIGWNAKTIWEMHLDEYGTRFPVSFKSFDDYKAPLYIYLTAPVVGLLGSTTAAVRLVSVLAGVVSIWLMGRIGGIIAALLLLITPWHWLLARPAFEANLALMFILGGVWLWRLGLKKPWWLLFSALSFAASLYSYQAPKIFVPVFIIGMIWIYRQQLSARRYWLLASGLLVLVFLFPLIKDGLGAGAKRLAMTSVFSRPTVNLPLELTKNYLVHFFPRWLFWSGGETGRTQMRQLGMLPLVQAPFLILGLIELWHKRKDKWVRVLWWWLLTAPLPAMIGFDVPHAIRAYQLLPVFILITALGLKQIKNKKIILIVLVLNFIYFLYHYLVTYPVESAREWQYGYQQAAQTAQEYEDRVDKIIISSYYGQPYIFTYWYQDRNPQAVFWGGMIKYLFRPVKLDGDRLLPNTLIIGAPEDIPAGSDGIIKEIYFPDGSVAFRAVIT